MKFFTPPNPLISVITPVYNAAHTLEETIKSVLGQTYDNIEYIIIDGGSTDGTLDILRKYDQSLDYWISEPDEGIYDAMNKGVRISKGEWLYFLGANDVLVDVLQRIAKKLRKNNKIYYGNVYWPHQNRLYDGEFKWHKLMKKNICHQAIFYPKNVFNHYHYDPAYTVCADYVLNLELWADKRFSFSYIPIMVCVFQDMDGMSRRETDLMFQRNKDLLIRKTFSKEMRNWKFYLFIHRLLIKVLDIFGIKHIVQSIMRK